MERSLKFKPVEIDGFKRIPTLIRWETIDKDSSLAIVHPTSTHSCPQQIGDRAKKSCLRSRMPPSLNVFLPLADRRRVEQRDDSPVCSNELCGFLDPDNFSRWRRKFYVKEGLAHYANETRYVDKRGVERVKQTGYIGPNFHALRRAQATLLVAGGVDPKTVQARLGHESLNTTLNIYAEEVGENDRKAADFMGELLRD